MRLLVTGSEGFVGRAVMRAARRHTGVDVAIGGSRRSPDDRRSSRTRFLDVTSPVGAAFDDIDAVVHCVGVISPDQARCDAVNTEGTRRLLAAARGNGIERFVYLSTSGVFGDGVPDAAGDDPPTRPTSATSRSKLAAEQLVLAAGGIVVRPNWTFGNGDRWVRPGFAALARAVRYRDLRPSTLASVVWVDDLGRALVELAVQADEHRATAWNANHPDPVSTTSLLQWAARRPLAGPALRHDEARIELADRPDELRTLERIARDRVFASRSLWQRLGIPAAELSLPVPGLGAA